MLQRCQMYSESIDLWAVGCCIYFMLVGKTPFEEIPLMSALNEKIRNGDFMKLRPRYKALSAPAKSLIEGLLEKDVEKRLTV